jgi:hypothetical protein
MALSEAAPTIHSLLARVRAPGMGTHDDGPERPQAAHVQDMLSAMTLCLTALEVPQECKISAPRGSGKTTTVATFAACAMLAHPGIQIAIMCLSSPHREQVLQRMRDVLKELLAPPLHDFLQPTSTGHGLMLSLPEGDAFGSRVYVVDRAWPRGYRANLVVVDEYEYILSRDHVHSPRIIAIGTPIH